MIGRFLIAAAVLTLVSGPALACDLEMSEVQDYLAFVDFRGMNEQQQLEAEQKAVQEFHDKKMELGKASFLSRFKLEADPAPAQLASVN